MMFQKGSLKKMKPGYFFSFSSELASSTFQAHLADSKTDRHKLINEIK